MEPASADRLAEVLAAIDSLRAEVRALAGRPPADPRLADVLALVSDFAGSSTWTAGELLEDARRADSRLWFALDSIVGDRGDPAKRLGCWLARHTGAVADGYRLERAGRSESAWLYRVASGVSGV